jgi:hypothetical protein
MERLYLVLLPEGLGRRNNESESRDAISCGVSRSGLLKGVGVFRLPCIHQRFETGLRRLFTDGTVKPEEKMRPHFHTTRLQYHTVLYSMRGTASIAATT